MSQYQKFLTVVFIFFYVIIELLSDPLFLVPPPLWTGSIITNHLQAAIIGGVAVVAVVVVTYPLIWTWRRISQRKVNKPEDWFSLKYNDSDDKTEQGNVKQNTHPGNTQLHISQSPDLHKPRKRQEIEDELNRVLCYKEYHIIGKKSVREATLSELYEFAAWEIKEVIVEGMMFGSMGVDLEAREKWLTRLERAEHGQPIFEDQIIRNRPRTREEIKEKLSGFRATDSFPDITNMNHGTSTLDDLYRLAAFEMEKANQLVLENKSNFMEVMTFQDDWIDRLEQAEHQEYTIKAANKSEKDETSNDENLTKLYPDKYSAISLLQDLARLRTEGIITDQEFQAKKTEILNRL